MEKTKDYKIKFICRIQNGQFQQECYVDNVLQTGNFTPTVRSALRFFESFSPEQLTACLSEQQENAVVVFRTSAQEMQNFCNVLS